MPVAQGALDTITDYLTDARVLLQDTIAPYRYDDTSLLTAMNVAMLEGRRLRPDLFVFCDKHKHPRGVPFFLNADDQPVPIEPQFRLAFLYGMISHALMRDQEDIQDEKAAAFGELFNDILLGVRQNVMAEGANRR